MALIVAASVKKKASNVFGNIKGSMVAVRCIGGSLNFVRHEDIDFGRSSNAGI